MHEYPSVLAREAVNGHEDAAMPEFSVMSFGNKCAYACMR
jgi:hypothetical protein